MFRPLLQWEIMERGVLSGVPARANGVKKLIPAMFHWPGALQ